MEFNLALESRNIHSSPGPDGIDYLLMKHLPINYKLILVDIMNEIYCTGDFPSDWKRSYVHFIPKSDGKSVRPISLTSCMCKLFETLLKNRLMWWCEHFKLIPKSQSGFRKGQSCINNIIELILYAEDGFLHKRDTLAAFLEIEGIR